MAKPRKGHPPMDDKDIMNIVMANMLHAGRYIWMLNRDQPSDKRPKFNMPAAKRRVLERLGFGADLQNLQNIITRGDKRAHTLVQRTRELTAAFDSICPQLDPELRGSAVVGLLGVIDCATLISDRLHDIAHIGGRSKQQEFRSILIEIQEFALTEELPLVKKLRCDIPQVLDHLETPKPHKGKRK